MQKYYEDSKSNAAFMRCVDIMTKLIQKYGTQVLEEIDGKTLAMIDFLIILFFITAKG